MRFTLSYTAGMILCGVYSAALSGPLQANELTGADALLFADAFFKEKMEAYHVPGAVFTVVKDGKIIISRGYGFQDIDKKTPVDPAHTAWRLCSVTKTFTASAVMQQYERGRMDFTTDIRRSAVHLPRLFDEPLTMAHLLTHSGGFDERMQGLTAISKEAVPPVCGVVGRDLPPQITRPGRYYRYSNHGLTLAGCLLEKAAGKPWGSVIKDEILDPLGMQHTYLEKDQVPAGDLAQPYAYVAGKHRRLDDVFVNVAPAGSMLSTGDDMARYIAAQLYDGRGEPGILKEGTLRLMHATQFRMNPDVPGSAYGFYEDIRGGMRNVEHAGDLNGYASLLYLIPEKNTGFFVAYNLNPELRLREDLVRAFVARYFPAEETPVKHLETLTSEEESHVTGVYRLIRYSHNTWEKILGNTFLLEFKRESDHTLVLNLALGLTDPQHYTFVRREPQGLLFKETGGEGTLSIQFPANGDGAESGRTMMVTKYMIPAALEKLYWFELPLVQGIASGLCTLTILVVVLGWLIRAVRRRIKHIELPPAHLRLDRLLAASAGLYLVFYVLFAVVLILNQEAVLGDIRLQLYPVLVIPNVAFLALALHIYRLVFGWVTGSFPMTVRILHTVGAGMLLVFSAFLFYWNLLGMRI